MTKTEAIKKAYGDDWKSVSQIIDENGWIGRSGIRFRTFLNKNTKIQLSKHRFRPESLRGIENNNGWIKIESEDDLPTDRDKRYLICINGESESSIYEFNGDTLRKLFKYLENGRRITHYREFPTFPDPIY